MGKTSWGALCLLFTWAQGAPTDGGHRCPAAVSHAGRERRLPGLDIDILRQLQARSGIVLTSNGCPNGTGTNRCRPVRDLMIGLASPRSGPPHRLPAAVPLPVPACLYGKPAAVAGLRRYEDLVRPRDRLCAQLRSFPLRWRHPARQARGPPWRRPVAAHGWSGVTLPLMIGDRLPGDYALSQRNDAGLLSRRLPAPNPVVLYPMSKHHPTMSWAPSWRRRCKP